MDFLIAVLLFVVGVVFGIFWFAGVVLPLVYGLPKSLILASKGKLKWSMPPRYLISPIIWSTGLFLISSALLAWAPNVFNVLRESAAFNWGSIWGVGISLLSAMFSEKTRADMRADFDAFVKSARIEER